MRHPGRARRLLPALVITLLLALALPVRAEPSAEAPHTTAILVLDRSGSMAKNDPHDLAITSARAFVDMLDPADRVAVIAFDSTARTVLPLSEVGDGAGARKALSEIQKPVGQWTDIKGALDATLKTLDGQAEHPAVLLFTDGKPETQADGVPPGYMGAMDGLVSRLAGRNVPVFTIGLGQADFDVLGAIAAGTRAESFAATSATQVVPLFTQVLSQVKERQMAFTLDTAGQTRTFQVPPYTRRLTLSAVGSEGAVQLTGTSPSGTPLDQAPGLKTATGANYVVYNIPNPAPGTWTVRLAGAGQVQGQGQLESALRLELQAPQPYSQVPSSGAVPITAGVTGDPDPNVPLELWAQAGAAAPVKLEKDGTLYKGKAEMADGKLAVWAIRAGQEVARRTFRVYPTGAAVPNATGPGPAAAPAPEPAPWWPYALAVLAALAAALMAFGSWNWRRIRRREEVLSGRLGGLVLSGRGREAAIGVGPSMPTIPAARLATLEAQLKPSLWTPLSGLGLGRRELQIYIRATPGTRLMINGRPPGDGRLYHEDHIALGNENFAYVNPRLGRKPPVRSASGFTRPHRPTFKG